MLERARDKGCASDVISFDVNGVVRYLVAHEPEQLQPDRAERRLWAEREGDQQ